MTAIKSISQFHQAIDTNITRIMDISFMLTTSKSTEEANAQECKPESFLQYSPTTSSREGDEIAWEPTLSHPSNLPPQTSWQPKLNIHLPPMRLSAADGQQELQLPRYTAVSNPNPEALEQEHQKQCHKPVIQRFPWPQDESQIHLPSQSPHLLETADRNQSLQDYQTELELFRAQNHHHLTSSRAPQRRTSRSQRLHGRRHPRSRRRRRGGPNTPTCWELPIPVHSSNPYTDNASEMMPSTQYTHAQAQAQCITTQDHNTHYDSLSSPSSSTAAIASTSHSHPNNRSNAHTPIYPHSNKAYPLEQVDWIRYQKDDVGISWTPMLALFHKLFPENRLSDQCLSSRYYRDNRVPMVEWVNHYADQPSPPTSPPGPTRTPILLHDDKGKIRWMQAKVRDRASPEGKQLGIPYFLVDKHPERALAYAWVSEAHKEDARRVLRGEDLDDAQQAKKAQWRTILRMVEEAGEQHGDDDDDGGDTGGEGEGFASAAGVDIHSC